MEGSHDGEAQQEAGPGADHLTTCTWFGGLIHGWSYVTVAIATLSVLPDRVRIGPGAKGFRFFVREWQATFVEIVAAEAVGWRLANQGVRLRRRDGDCRLSRTRKGMRS
jgi:hypothetical protein